MDKIKIPKYIEEIKCHKVVSFITAQQKKKEGECLFCGKGLIFCGANYFCCDGCGAHMDCIAFLMNACEYTLEQALGRLKFDREIWT